MAGSALFRYPETVVAGITLTSDTPPAYIQARTTGRLKQLYVTNGQKVNKGDILAIIENVAEENDVLELCERLKAWQMSGSRLERLDEIFLHRLSRLGSIQSAYSSCLSAWDNYLQHMHESRLYKTELTSTVTGLMTAIDQWKADFLAIAPIDGKTAFMQLWKENRYAASGETMFVIVPDGEYIPVGKALVPMQGIGKVKKGQRTVVRLNGLSEQEYGFVEGEVASVSPVPDEGGNYVVEIVFPNRLRTRYKKELPVLKVMEGTAEIIISEQNLLERLFKH